MDLGNHHRYKVQHHGSRKGVEGDLVDFNKRSAMINGEGFGFILWLVILAVIIAGVVWFVRSQLLAGSQRSLERHSPALEALEERYARGEINREEYLQKKRADWSFMIDKRRGTS